MDRLFKLSPSRFLLYICGWTTLLRFTLALSLPITYKEAYFWEWSQNVQPGYLEHPPMIAWLIGLSCTLFPWHAPWVVRLPAVLLGSLSLCLSYRLGSRLFMSHRMGVRSCLLASCLPLIHVLGVLSVPDSPMLFFQLLALNLLIDLRDKAHSTKILSIGFVWGLALLSKVVALVSLGAWLGFWACDRSKLFPLGRKQVLLCIFAALASFTPFLWWNATHSWAHVRLQLWERHFWDFGFAWTKGAEIIFEQFTAAFLLFPLLLYSLCLPLSSLPLAWQSRYRFLRWQAAAMLLLLFTSGCFITQAHPHWSSPAFATLPLLLAVAWEKRPTISLCRWLPSCLAGTQCLLTGLTAALVVFPQLMLYIPAERLGGPLGRGLIKGQQRLLGHAALAEALDARVNSLGLDRHPAILSDGYQLSSPLAFAWQHGPVVCLPAFTDQRLLLGHAQAYYLEAKKWTGGPGLYVSRSRNRHLHATLSESFQTVHELEALHQSYAGEEIATYRLFYVEGWLQGKTHENKIEDRPQLSLP